MPTREMVKFEVVEKLREVNLLDPAVRTGVIPITVLSHFQIYKFYLKTRPQCKTDRDALITTAVQFNMSCASVRKIKRQMSK